MLHHSTRYRLVLPYDDNWGSPMKNGTFNGMVGMVHRQVGVAGLGGYRQLVFNASFT